VPGRKKKRLLPVVRYRKKPFTKICGARVPVDAGVAWAEAVADLEGDGRTVSGEVGN